MGAEQVHGALPRRGRVVLLQGAQGAVEFGRIQRRDRAVAVLPVAVAQEAEDGVAEAIVHGAVELVAEDTGAHIRLEPRFGVEHGVGVFSLDHIAELLEEARVEVDHVGDDVDAPAVHAGETQPAHGDAVFAQPVFHDVGVGVVELGQGVNAGPLFVGRAACALAAAGGGIVEEEPVAVGAAG